MNWLEKIEQDPSQIDHFITTYNDYLDASKREVSLEGHVERLARAMPAITDNRFAQLHEVEAVLVYVEIQMKKERSALYRQYLEHYSRALSSRDVEKYIDGEASYIEWLMLRNKVALVRNKYLSITKALEVKHFQITNIIKLKAAGIDDVSWTQ